MSTLRTVLIVIAFVVLAADLACFAVTLLKGKWRLGLIVWLGGIGLFVWPVLASRLAIPTSRWARRFYEGADKADEAWQRFGPRIQAQKERKAKALVQSQEYARQRAGVDEQSD